jgi:putative ABC transport system permease protein
MTLGTAASLAARSLRRSPLRAVLTGAGLIIGVVAITLSVASGEGARRAVMQQWRAMVGNLDALFISPGGAAQRGMATMENSTATLTPDDAIAVRAGVPNVNDVAIEQSAFSVGVEANGRNGTTALLGVSPNWSALRGDRIAQGAMFTAQQNDEVARVAVIGDDLAKLYFAGGSAVGQRIKVSGIDLEVVGVLERNGAGPGGASMDNLVLIPINTSARRVFNRANINQIRVQMVDPSKSDETSAAVTALLRQRHQLAEGQLDDFRISTPRAMMARRQNVDSSLRRTILSVGVLVLVLGGVMVANLMYASTADRTPEIGMRRAVGAKRGDILRQFWAEAAGVSILSGVLGVLLSLVAVVVGSRVLHYPLAVSWPVTGMALAATIIIGLAAGYFPAHRASAMSPADVLRRQG